MKVLIACEESQRVCTEFRRLGHEAYSCDIQECSGGHPEWHVVEDALQMLENDIVIVTLDGKTHFIDKWDLMIAHPPCTYLSKSGGNRLRINGVLQQQRYEQGCKAAEFFMRFYHANCEKIAIENPIPMKIFNLPKYDQIIQPCFFGDPWLKTTCLWLKGLPRLIPSNPVTPTGRWVNCTDHRKIKKNDSWHKSGVKKAKDRAKTFLGIANAMASQWGGKDDAVRQLIFDMEQENDNGI